MSVLVSLLEMSVSVLHSALLAQQGTEHDVSLLEMPVTVLHSARLLVPAGHRTDDGSLPEMPASVQHSARLLVQQGTEHDAEAEEETLPI